MTEPIHDPLCPQQPRADGATLEMRNGKVVYCGCDLIAEVIAAAVQRVEAVEVPYSLPLGAPVGVVIDQMRREFIAAIKGDQP